MTDIEINTYDLFITELDNEGIIKQYSIYDASLNMNIQCIVHLKVPRLLYYADNYKLVDGKLVELTEEEKPKPQPEPEDKITLIEQQVLALEEENMVLSEYVLGLEMKSLEQEEAVTMTNEYVLDLDMRLTNIESK